MAYVGQHVFVDEYDEEQDTYRLEHYRVSDVLADDVVHARPLHDIGPERIIPADEYHSSDFSEVEYMPVEPDTLDEVAEWCGGITAGTEVVTLPVGERTVAAPTGTTLILLLTDDREAGWRVRTANGSAIQEAWF